MNEYYLIDLARYNDYYDIFLKLEIRFIFDKDLKLEHFSPILVNSFDFNKVNFQGEYVVLFTRLNIDSLKKIVLNKISLFNSSESNLLFRFYDPRVLLIFLETLDLKKKQVLLSGIVCLALVVYGRVISFSLRKNIGGNLNSIILNDCEKSLIDKKRLELLIYDFYLKQKEYFGFEYLFILNFMNFMFLVKIYNFYEISRVLELIKTKKITLFQLVNEFEFIKDVDSPDSMRVNQIYLNLEKKR